MVAGACHVERETSLEIRRLMDAVADVVARETSAGGPAPGATAARIGPWPEEAPAIAESVTRFVPTAILLNRRDALLTQHVSEDLDYNRPARFLSAISLVEDTLEYDWGRRKVIGARVFLLPPAPPEEAAERADLLAAADKGVPLVPESGWQRGMLTGRLQGVERSLARHLSPYDQLALAAVLAARGGPAAFLSRSGTWPDSPVINLVVHRLGCRVVRLTLEGIPEQVLSDIRVMKYLHPDHRAAIEGAADPAHEAAREAAGGGG